MYGTAYSKICPLLWPDSAIDVTRRLVATTRNSRHCFQCTACSRHPGLNPGQDQRVMAEASLTLLPCSILGITVPWQPLLLGESASPSTCTCDDGQRAFEKLPHVKNAVRISSSLSCISRDRRFVLDGGQILSRRIPEYIHFAACLF